MPQFYTRSQRERLAARYRRIAGRLYADMHAAKAAGESALYERMQSAHDSACRLFNALESGE